MLPPSFAVLEQRLRTRSSERPEAIATRLEAARREVGRYPDYNYVIINDDLDRSTELLRSIVLVERARPSLMGSRIRLIVDSFK